MRKSSQNQNEDLKSNDSNIQKIKDADRWNNFESAFTPILDTLNLVAGKLSEVEQQENANLIKEIKENLQLQCYELALFGIKYVLNTLRENQLQSINSENGDFNNHFENKKSYAQLYISNIKRYLQTESMKNGMIQFSKLMKNPDFKYESDEEGFFDEEQTKEKQLIKKTWPSFKFSKENRMLYDMKEYSDDQSSNLQSNEEKIRQLEESVKLRDNYLNSLTKGYMKDIAHMKEMVFKKDFEVASSDLYEVSYFDTLNGLDESTLKAVKEKLLSVKQQYIEKELGYIRKITYLQNEFEKLKRLYATVLNTQGDTYEMFKRIFNIQDNPYILWKQIQEIRGNKFFFDVFERQRQEYGINYKEVNQMLLSKRAYEREYSGYKQQMDDQLISLIGRCRVEIEEIRKEISLNEEEILKLTSESFKSTSSKMNLMLLQMRELLELRMEEERIIYEREKQNILFECVDRDRLFMRDAFSRWILVKDILKIKQSHFDGESLISQLKRVILAKNPVVAERIRMSEFKMAESQELYEKTLTKLEDCEMKSIIYRNENKEYEEKQKQNEFEISTQKQQIIYLKQSVKQLESKSIMQKGVIENIHKILQNKIDDINFEVTPSIIIKIYLFLLQQSLDAEEERLLSAKNLVKRIEDRQQQRSVREELLQFEKIDLIHDEIIDQESNKSQSTITELFDIYKPINYNSALDKQLKQYKLELAQQFQQETQDLREQLEEYERIEDEGGYMTHGNDKNRKTKSKGQSSKKSSLLFKTIMSEQCEDKSVQTDGQEQEKQEMQIQEMQEELSLLKQQLKEVEQDLSSFKEGQNQQKNAASLKQNEKFKIPKFSNIQQLVKKQDDPNNNKNKQKIRKVFQRLYDDSKDKVTRMHQLKQHVDSLEQFQWEEVLTILNLFSKQQPVLSDIDRFKDSIQSLNQSPKADSAVGHYEQAFQVQQNYDDQRRQSAIEISKKIKSEQDNLIRPASRAEFYYKKNSSRAEQFYQKQQSHSRDEKNTMKRGESSFESFQMLQQNQSFESNHKQYLDQFQSGLRKNSMKQKTQQANQNILDLPAKMTILSYPKFEFEQEEKLPLSKSQKAKTSFNFYSSKISHSKKGFDGKINENSFQGKALLSRRRDSSILQNTFIKNSRSESQGRCQTAGSGRVRQKSKMGVDIDCPSNRQINSPFYSFLKSSDNLSLVNLVEK